MTPPMHQELLRSLPAITDLLVLPTVTAWLEGLPRPLVTDCLRRAVEALRRQILNDTGGRYGSQHVTAEAVLLRAQAILEDRTAPHVREAINATGIILHTGLGRAVCTETVVDSMVAPMKGYTLLAVDRETGERIERDELVEYLLTELTGAEAATVVNNNAAATLLVLAALAAPREAVVSRGQLIEIGGLLRLPDVAQRLNAKGRRVGQNHFLSAVRTGEETGSPM